MRCRQCDYSLWNLTARQCPECGAPFSPRDYEFVPNSVRFCCPHCGQEYYGTGPTGLLVPDAFECVKCGRGVTLDEMVLRPAEGLADEQTKVGANPWLERDRIGGVKGWWKTVVLALTSPNRLAQGTPEASSVGQAWWFAIVTNVVTMGVALIPAMCIGLGIPLMHPQTSGGPSAASLLGFMAGGLAFGLVFAFGFVLVVAWMWGLLTHVLLRVGGPDHGPLRVTMHSILYTSGTMVVSVVPCIGKLAMVWWIVSAIVAVKESHGIGGLRATFAVLTGPVIGLVLFVAFYITIFAVGISSARTAAGAVPPALRTGSTQTILNVLANDAAIHGGRGPAHALELVQDRGLKLSDFIDPNSLTVPRDVPVAGMTLQDLGLMEADDRAAVIAEAAAALPDDVVAYRVGDFVFTYPGAVLDGRTPQLWLVVMTPDPDVNPASPPVIIVGRADRMLMQIPARSFPARLEQQNRLRASHGLPPLPDPRTVTHEAPAVADPDVRYDPD